MKRVILLSVLLTTALTQNGYICRAHAADQNAGADKKSDKTEELNSALGRLQMAKESILFFAKRLKANSYIEEQVLAEGAFLYEQVRASFNAWVNAVENDFSARQSIQDTGAYTALADEANKRTTRFIDFAKKHESIKLTSDSQNGGIGILNNITLNCDLNKIMDQTGQALVSIGKTLMDSVNYWQVRSSLEGLRLEPFKTLGPPDVIASLRETPQDRAFETEQLLKARLFMAAGNIDTGVSKYVSGFSSLLDRASKAGRLSNYDEAYIQDYMNILNKLSDKAEIKNASAKIGIFLKNKRKN